MAGPWITDRLPTAEDGDDDGDVLAAHSYETHSGHGVAQWHRVIRNQPWMRIHEAEKRPARKIVQLIAADGYVLALADDGAAFRLHLCGLNNYKWMPLPPLPQS